MIKSTLNYSTKHVQKVVLHERKKAMKEPDAYRPILESLLSSTHGKRILSQSDVARHLNKSRGWVREKLEVKKDGISVEALAMKLAKEFT